MTASTRRVKNIADAIFFALRGLCRETAQASADRIGETRSGLSPHAAALASGHNKPRSGLRSNFYNK